MFSPGRRHHRRSKTSLGLPPAPLWARAALLLAVGIVAGCTKTEDASADVNLTTIVFPSGTKIVAETVRSDFEMRRGMMFRTSLAPGRGMLFVHPKQDKYTYWMYQVKIPLDLIWIDRDRKVVEVLSNVQPCTTNATQCPHYGGHYPANFVLEVNAGVAAKNNLQEGNVVDF
jgi:uncharacterized membrane protein (UPF0127 family)